MLESLQNSDQNYCTKDPQNENLLEENELYFQKSNKDLILIEGYDTKDLTTVNETNEQSSTV